jgi:hypothetical protein
METYDSAWVNQQIGRTTEAWHGCARESARAAGRYRASEQDIHEQEYDEALCEVEGDLQCASENMRERIVTSFGKFSARALSLDEEAINLLTREFLPVGTHLALWARRHCPDLEMADIIQAARNAWTACGLQPLLGAPIKLTPSILGYSLLYPHSDNHLDSVEISLATKLECSRRFRCRLQGESLPPEDERECAMWALITLIENQYPRPRFPHVFECLLAIHQAQENSVSQLNGSCFGDVDSLRLSFAKGGTSVLADACLARGSLSTAESRFAFEWGVLLQLGDDLQDLHDDMRRGSATLFSNAAASGAPLDELAMQLLNFSDKVGEHMDELPHGTTSLKKLLKMSWRSLIIRAIADSHDFFSKSFLHEAEQCSPFRFAFLRERKNRLASRKGLYATLFEVLLEPPVGAD